MVRVLTRLVYVGEAAYDNNESVSELISCEGRLILSMRSFNKLQWLFLATFLEILEIQIVGMSESLESLSLVCSPSVQSLSGLSNLKNLKSFSMDSNNGLQVVKGLNELEFLDYLEVRRCTSLESLIDVSNTKLPNHCIIDIYDCGEEFRGTLASYKHRKEVEQQLEQEQESPFEQEQEQQQESHFKLELELKQRTRLGRVSFQCLSFSSFSTVFSLFFPI
ncbi:uncharacterized protein LOC120292947 [Eucalyptus grandis]|uniref:uncharacterized protein LOC120292947 n=1 Tax=Eucalyptus grandis TaxID=71139 RepID=UPI00192E95F0|nr:uncharacterized protein LOC120292947 [Eucalyptus grandis]